MTKTDLGPNRVSFVMTLEGKQRGHSRMINAQLTEEELRIVIDKLLLDTSDDFVEFLGESKEL